MNVVYGDSCLECALVSFCKIVKTFKKVTMRTTKTFVNVGSLCIKQLYYYLIIMKLSQAIERASCLSLNLQYCCFRYRVKGKVCLGISIHLVRSLDLIVGINFNFHVLHHVFLSEPSTNQGSIRALARVSTPVTSLLE